MAGQLGCLVSLGDLLGCFGTLGGVWGTLAGHLGRLGSLLGVSSDVSGTFEAGIRAVWVALGDGLGCLTRGLGNPREVSKALGGAWGCSQRGQGRL